MPTPVTVRVQSDEIAPTLVDGVSVQVYDAGTSTLVSTGTTATDGEVLFALPDGDYDLRFYKKGMSVINGQPQRITVDSALGNIFTVDVHLITRPESIDLYKCRVTGTFIGPDGNPLKGEKVSLIPSLEIMVINGNTVGPLVPMLVTSDEDGYVDFTLLRGSRYKGYIVGADTMLNINPMELDIRCPDLPATDVSDLLFPLPVSLVFDPTTKTLALGSDPDVSGHFVVHYSDGSTRNAPPMWVGLEVHNSDDTVVEAVLLCDGVVSLTPKAAGTAVITMTRAISALTKWNPEPAFTSGTLTVTVA